MKKGQLQDYALRMCVKNGEMRWASLNAYVLRDENDAPVRRQVVAYSKRMNLPAASCGVSLIMQSF
jgi:hypothetical protein